MDLSLVDREPFNSLFEMQAMDRVRACISDMGILSILYLRCADLHLLWHLLRRGGPFNSLFEMRIKAVDPAFYVSQIHFQFSI